MHTLSVLTGDVGFTEGPRWREGRLWFSEIAAGNAVKSVSLAGDLRTEVEVDDPRGSSGLGWTADGDLLFVSMSRGRLLRRSKDGAVHVHADLSAISPWHWNDMVVDREGRAYVGEFGFDFDAAAAARGLESIVANHPTGRLACVQPDGTTELAAEDMHFPNGSVITPDGKTLIVAETFGARLTAFDIGPKGRLSNRRVWAALGPYLPDGICLDADGAVWLGDPIAAKCVRVAEGGEVLEVIDTALPCFACMLGGEVGRTLFMLTSPWSPGEKGRILMTEADSPHAGCP
ncbi:MAG: SMP-30/gluconolactonase/LRE family protein [Caulobacterales bacterium]